MRVAAVGFDLGDTLLTYADTPLNWATLYPAALARLAATCAANPGEEELTCAAQILARYNTRLHPRRAEVSAEIIFREILGAWGLTPERWLRAAIGAFFGF